MKTLGKCLLIMLSLALGSSLFSIKDTQVGQAESIPVLNLVAAIPVGGTPDAIAIDYYGNYHDILFYDRAMGRVRCLDGLTLALVPEEIVLPTESWDGWVAYDRVHRRAYFLTTDTVWNDPDTAWSEVTVNSVAGRQLLESFSVNGIYNQGMSQPPDTFYEINGFTLKQPAEEGGNPARLLIDNARGGRVDVVDLDFWGSAPLVRQRFTYRDPVEGSLMLNSGNTLALESRHETQSPLDLSTSDVLYVADKNRPWLEHGYGYLRRFQIGHYPGLLNPVMLPEVVLDAWPFPNGVQGLAMAPDRDRLYVASGIQSFDDGYLGVVDTALDQLEGVTVLGYADPGFVYVDWYDTRRVFVTTFDGFYNDPDQGLYLSLVYDDAVIERIQLMTQADEYNGVRGMAFDPYTSRLYLTVADQILVVEVGYGAQPAPSPLVSASAVVTPAGGTLAPPDGRTRVEFPPGSVSAETVVTYTETVPLPAGELAGSRFFDLSAVISVTGTPVTAFSQAYTLTVDYRPAEVGPVVDGSLGLYGWDGTEWVREPSSQVDLLNRQVIATPDHMTRFAVLGETRRLLLPVVLR
jgi:hypothetical protein